ncbi:MAG: hypothetical protein ACLPID_21110 [Beijerinckiaceae bacterium]
MTTRQAKSSVSTFKSKEWATFADRAIEAVNASEYGDRVQTYIKLGQEFGLEHSVVRRIVAARQFLSKLEIQQPELARELLSVPYPSIDPFRRWYAHDKGSALAAAWEVVQGKRSVRSLRTLEKAARRPRSISEMSIKEREDYAIQAIEKDLPKGYCRVPLGKWAGSSIDSIFEFRDPTGKKDQRRKKYALMVIGPFANAKVYDHRRADLLLQVAGAMSFGFDVIVALAETQALDSYSEALKEVGLINVEVRAIGEPRTSKARALAVGKS